MAMDHDNWPGVRAELIGGTAYQPVCAPPVAKRLARPAEPGAGVGDLGTTMLSRDAWRAEVGLDPAIKLTGPFCSDCHPNKR